MYTILFIETFLYVCGNSAILLNNIHSIHGKSTFLHFSEGLVHIVYPVTKEGRQMLNESVLAAYEAQRQAAEQDAGTEAMQEAPEGVPMSSIQ